MSQCRIRCKPRPATASLAAAIGKPTTQIWAPVRLGHWLTARHLRYLSIEELGKALNNLPALFVSAVEEAGGRRLEFPGGHLTQLLLVHHHNADAEHAYVVLPNRLERSDEPAPRGRGLSASQREAVPGRLVMRLHPARLVEEDVVGCKQRADMVRAGVKHVPLVFVRKLRHEHRIVRGCRLLCLFQQALQDVLVPEDFGNRLNEERAFFNSPQRLEVFCGEDTCLHHTKIHVTTP
mmetsp:Transcript_94182/g.170115  ORF Transcript_94182/g.170115 Transcript_94182/m.170115 type:complete len:236 (-) Transcript_94182:227-934(-)